jgi:DNA replication protein DnaC
MITELTPYEIRNGIRYYDFKKSCYFLQYLGKQHYGPKFRLHNSDKKILYKLFVYAIRDEENSAKHGIDLNKGILLIGPVGCGKTSLLTLMRHFVYRPNLYQIKSTREIAAEYQKDGHSTVMKYGKLAKPICLDDLGVENSIKHYGNECNTIGEVLLYRYELLQHSQIVTHATTNLDADQLEELYGNRIRSRLRAMFNLISFDQVSQDKRI